MNGVWLLLLTTAGLAELNSDYMLLTMFLLQHESRLEEKTPQGVREHVIQYNHAFYHDNAGAPSDSL